ncbi:hypothetical protein L218DRAFT_988556 [Marasmius fiardii PR-910]|nr:hypothetical protein L218DRAFT_988556 [Marasmius fiardii PR-910]
MITRFSIVTLVFFIISIILVIKPLSFSLHFPYVGRRRISLNLLTAPIATIALLWAAQCLGPTQIRNGIVGTDGIKPYNILILFFSLAYMAITLDITGALQAAAFWVSNKGGSNGRKLFLYFYLMLTVLGVILGNDPVVLSGTPFLVYYTRATDLEPIPWLIAEFAAANTASMVLFVGNLTNVTICEGFRINNIAFSAYTILPFLACIVTCFVTFAFQFFRSGHIPKQLQHKTHLNPRDVLCDPVGAWVGSILLGSCLVVVIVVSFFHVDVWKVTLPFAVAKCIWDLCWDHHLYTTGQLPCICPRPSSKGGEEGDPGDSTAGRQTEDLMLSAMSLTKTEPRPVKEETCMHTTAPASTNVNHPSTSTPKPFLDVPATGGGASETRSEKIRADSETTKRPENDTAPFPDFRRRIRSVYTSLSAHFPTVFTAIPRLPFALAPFSFSQFILIEALTHQGWIDVFARWLVIASKGQIHPCIWLVGVLGVILCNIAGTNIGATILLTKVVRAAQLSSESTRASGIALAVASNIGAVSFTFSASLAGLLWKMIIQQKGVKIKQQTFAFWNLLPILAMTGVGLGVVSAEMAVLYR